MISILIVVVLPAPFGPEQAEELALLDREADAPDRLDVLPLPPQRSGGGSVGAMQFVSLDDGHGLSLATPESAASRRLDPEHVAGRELDGRLRGQVAAR